MKKYLFTLVVLLGGGAGLADMVAQDTWSLQRCIGHALKNLTIRQSQANVKIAQLGESQAKASRLPNLNFSANLGEQFGTTIDPSQNTFVSQNIITNSLNLSAGVPLYSGGQINHSIKQAKMDVGAATADMEQSTNTLALQVASAYLTVLLNQEQLANTQSQASLSRKQLANTMKLIEAGNLPMVDRYNLEAQIAREEQNVITAENNLNSALLNIKQLMQMEPDFDLRLEQPNINVNELDDLTALSLGTVFETAKTTQPSVKASEFRIKSAEESVQVARAGYLPTVSLFGNMSSFYSSQNQDFVIDDNGVLVDGTTRPVKIAGIQTVLTEQSPAYSFKDVAYLEQLDRTFGQSFGLQLNVPVYQNGRVRLAVERAKLGVLNAELQSNQVQQQLKNDIQTSLANARNAKKQLEASQRTYDAALLAYTNTEKRHAIGAANSLEINTAKNNMDIAANNRTVARYDYIFRVKILEFYMGKPIILNQK